MKGYQTTACVLCGKIHDTAANCPAYQAVCPSCKEVIEKKKVEN